jgi:hypothetical protein
MLRRQIDKSLDCLDAGRISDERIHRARKQIKMARATLRLLRRELPNKQYCTRPVRKPLTGTWARRAGRQSAQGSNACTAGAEKRCRLFRVPRQTPHFMSGANRPSICATRSNCCGLSGRGRSVLSFGSCTPCRTIWAKIMTWLCCAQS